MVKSRKLNIASFSHFLVYVQYGKNGQFVVLSSYVPLPH